MSDNSVKILLVEDDAGDVDLTRICLKDSELRIDLTAVDDGVKAVQYLRRQGPYGNAQIPDLILLDLNLPRKDGREVLADIKQDPALKHIPVVILTTSTADADIRKSYSLGANCYVAKPLDFEQFRKAMQALEHFWFRIAEIPSRPFDKPS